MELAPDHVEARTQAIRIPALQASLDLLVAGSAGPAQIELYAAPAPLPGEPPASPALAVLDLQPGAGVIDAAQFRIVLTTPIEGQVTGADPEAGTDAVWGRIVDGEGAWWADVTVSDEAGDGDIRMQSVRLINGAFARLASAEFRG